MKAMQTLLPPCSVRLVMNFVNEQQKQPLPISPVYKSRLEKRYTPSAKPKQAALSSTWRTTAILTTIRISLPNIVRL